MWDSLKLEVFNANIMLPQYNLVTLTWGNVSACDREAGIVAIKPSGLDYSSMSSDSIVILDLNTGKVLDGSLKPSSDSPTHLELYRRFPNIGGVVHTHSRFATIFAQSCRHIPPLGTTHADYFYGSVPCTRALTEDEVITDYEGSTGKVIAETFRDIDPGSIPAVLVACHGPFTWGKTPLEAVKNAVVLEEVAFMAWHNHNLNPHNLRPIDQFLLDKHYNRKHGANAYYGQ